MKPTVYLTITILAAACGDNDTPEPLPTWGDAVLDASSAFCEARERCGWATPEEYEGCVDLNVTELCTERWDCDLLIDDESKEVFDQCALDLGAPWCGPFLPASCYIMLELKQ